MPDETIKSQKLFAAEQCEIMANLHREESLQLRESAMQLRELAERREAEAKQLRQEASR